METVSLDTIGKLDEYLTAFGPLLAKQAGAAVNPLHVPARDPIPAALDAILRPLFPAQAHVVAAMAKALDRQKSVTMAGEMGTGKTAIGAAAAHLHAKGKPYRALVMAPDHLIDKWRREVLAVIPGASVTVFDGWRDVLALEARKGQKPAGPEWFIIGRDQAKNGAAWEPMAVRKQTLAVVETGDGTAIKLPVTYWTCPKCGAIVTNRKGDPASWEEIKGTGGRRPRCPASLDGTEDGPKCGEPLWQNFFKPDRKRAEKRQLAVWHPELLRPAALPRHRLDRRPDLAPYRWAPEAIIKRRLGRGFFDYALFDEAHEEKSATSAQGNAMGTIAASARRTILLTGTILGGYAWHVFAGLWRTNPGWMVEAGFEWGRDMAFTERYGRIQEVVVTREKAESGGRANTMSRGSAEVTRRKNARPGIMPGLFSDMLMSSTIFLALDEISDALPPRPGDEIQAIACDEDVQKHYENVEQGIAAAIAPMLVRGDTSLLARMLQALLTYQDHPFGWGDSEYLEPFGLDGRMYDVDPDRVLPKEQAILDLCVAEKAAGRQVWVYVQQTHVRSSVPRLVELLKGAGLRVGVLDDRVERKKREAWIHQKGGNFDVAISHPMLVQTGLDLFDLSRNVNFATIVWFQTGYSLFTLMQASRRAWRIGQPKPCRVIYQYYTGGMQERAMGLMGTKLAAAEALGGRFSAEGLAALGGEDGDSEAMALARALTQRLDPAARAWAKVSHAPRVIVPGKAAAVAAVATRAAAAGETPAGIVEAIRAASGAAAGDARSRQRELF